jgi:Tol biopolymer transport system component
VSADGSTVLFIRGGGLAINPTNSSIPVERTLFCVPTSGGEVTSIASGPVSSPTLSPDGTLVAFAKGADVWLSAVADPVRTERAFVARGLQRDLVFSPDGGKIAFVSYRGIYGEGDYSFVGVYDLKKKTLTYLSPGLGNDQSPVWSSDGTRVAFLRVPLLTCLLSSDH